MTQTTTTTTRTITPTTRTVTIVTTNWPPRRIPPTTTSSMNSHSSGRKKPDDGRGSGPPGPGTGPDIPSESPPRNDGIGPGIPSEKPPGNNAIGPGIPSESPSGINAIGPAMPSESPRTAKAIGRGTGRAAGRMRDSTIRTIQNASWSRKKQYYYSEAGQRWQKQYRARKTERAALLRRQRGSMVQKRTKEKRQALGPLTLSVALEDFMQDFYDTLSPCPEDCMDQPETITDYSVGNESSLSSSCDMWDEGKGFLNNLLEDLPSPSDDSLYEVLRDLGPWSPQESDFDLEDFVS